MVVALSLESGGGTVGDTTPGLVGDEDRGGLVLIGWEYVGVGVRSLVGPLALGPLVGVGVGDSVMWIQFSAASPSNGSFGTEQVH